MTSPDSNINTSITHNAYIASHKGIFSSLPYDNNIHYRFKLQSLPADFMLVIEFIYLKIGEFISCQTRETVSDVLRIYRNNGAGLIWECGDIGEATIPNVVVSANSSESIVVEFFTDGSGQFKGFILQYSGKIILFSVL